MVKKIAKIWKYRPSVHYIGVVLDNALPQLEKSEKYLTDKYKIIDFHKKHLISYDKTKKTKKTLERTGASEKTKKTLERTSETTKSTKISKIKMPHIDIDSLLSYSIDFIPQIMHNSVHFVFYADLQGYKLEELRSLLTDKETKFEAFNKILNFCLQRLHHRILCVVFALPYRSQVLTLSENQPRILKIKKKEQKEEVIEEDIEDDTKPEFVPFIYFIKSPLFENLANFNNYDVAKKIARDANCAFTPRGRYKRLVTMDLEMWFYNKETNTISKERILLDPDWLASKFCIESFCEELPNAEFTSMEDKVDRFLSEIMSFRITVRLHPASEIGDGNFAFENCVGRTPCIPEMIEAFKTFFKTNSSVVGMPLELDTSSQ